MAMILSYSNKVVHFRYDLLQKTTAYPVLGHRMIKFLEPLITRIGVRVLHNDSRREIRFGRTQCNQQKCGPNRTGDGQEYDCEGRIRTLLSSPLPLEILSTEFGKVEDTCYLKLATDLRDELEHYNRKHSGSRLYKKILRKSHISKMWEIARYNPKDSAAAMLPQEHDSTVWKVKGRAINKEGLRRNLPKFKFSVEFPLEGNWEMNISGGDNSHEYPIVFRRGRSIGKPGLVHVEKTPSGVPPDVKPCELAFGFGAKGPWPDHFMVYIRSAGPNVLVGQAWKASENPKKLWGEILLVKVT